MSAIGPGDFVECVLAAASQLRLGAMYCVEEVVRPDGDKVCGYHHSHDCGGLALREITLPPGQGFCARSFKPIYRPKADLIESLKAPPKKARKPSKQDVHA